MCIYICVNCAGRVPLHASSYFHKQSFQMELHFTIKTFPSTVSVLLRKLKQQSREHMETRRPDLVRALSQMGDFYMELKWDFQSWGRFSVPSCSYPQWSCFKIHCDCARVLTLTVFSSTIPAVTQL